MPQKRNAKLCGEIVTIGAQARSLVPLALEAVIHSHEVDGARSAIMDEAVEQALILAADALIRLRDVLGGLQVFSDRMRRNLDMTGGLIMAEAIATELAASIGRAAAEAAVARACDRSLAEGVPLATVLRNDPELRPNFTDVQIDRLTNPASYLGCAGAFVDRIVARVAALS